MWFSIRGSFVPKGTHLTLCFGYHNFGLGNATEINEYRSGMLLKTYSVWVTPPITTPRNKKDLNQNVSGDNFEKSWFKLSTLYMQSTSWETRLEEAQVGIKIAGRNINNLTYADDTTLMQKAKKN